MAGFICNYTFKDNAYIEIEGTKYVKFWEGEGLHSYEGDLEGFGLTYPSKLEELIIRKIIKKRE